MLSDTEILSRLQQCLGPDSLPDVVGRLLRLPAVWAFLREGSADLNGSLAPEELTPAALAWRAVGHPCQTDAFGSLDPAQETRLQRLWDQAVEGVGLDADLISAALLAIGLLRLAEAQGLGPLADKVLEAPRLWQTPVSLLYPCLTDGTAFLRALVERDRPNGLVVGARMLLSNVPEAQAAWILADAIPDLGADDLLRLESTGEASLARQVGTLLAEARASKSPAKAPTSTAQLTQAATLLRIQGADGEALRSLEAAWDAAAEDSARVADHMAEVAGQQADPVVGLQARREAVRLRPTPLRRAALAMALVDAGQAQEALRFLPETADSIEEWIAAGHAYLRQGDTSAAAGQLTKAAIRAGQRNEPVAPAWLRRLAQAQQACGQIDAAISTHEVVLGITPTDVRTRLDLAVLLNEAGDPSSAIDHAALALGLAPESLAARRLLASGLQLAGQADEALPHWQELAAHNPADRGAWARSCLQVGDAAQALEICHQILADDPEDIEAKIIQAQALTSLGQHSQAAAMVQDLLRLAPQDGRLWVALADAQHAAGDPSAAVATLRRAAASAPGQAQISAALASALSAQGQITEAVEAIRAARAVQPSNPDYQLQEGKLLREMGQPRAARPLLEAALRYRPRDLSARLPLAQAYEDENDLAQAARLLQDLPSDATPQVSRLAGRILCRGAQQLRDADLAKKALHHLETAVALHPEDPEIHYYLGMANEQVGVHDKAIVSYRACLGNLDGVNDPLHLQATLGLARAAVARGEPTLAFATLETARQAYPESVELLVVLSDAYLAAGQPEPAARAAEEAILLDPRSQAGLSALRRSAVAHRDWPTAQRALEQLVALSPNNVAAWIDLAETGLHTGETSLGRSALAQALRLGRQNASVLRQAASLLRRMNDLAGAQLALKASDAKGPGNGATLRDLARVSEMRGDHQAAAQAWLGCTQVEGEHVEPLLHAARAFEALGRGSEAIGLMRRALSLQPDNASLTAALARANISAGEPLQALNHYARALELDPADADLAWEAGEASIRQGVLEEALELLQKAADLTPDRAEIRVSLGECQFRLGKMREARHSLEQIPAPDHQSVRGQSILALVSAALADARAAVGALDAAARLPVRSAEEAAWLSKAALRLGHWALAADSLRQAPAASSQQARAGLRQQAARTRLLTRAAGWLLEAVDAHQHAAAATAQTASALEELAGALLPSSGATVQDSEVKALEALADMLAATFEGNPERAAAMGAAASVPETGLAMAVFALRGGQPQRVLEMLEAGRLPAARSGWISLAAALAFSQIGKRAEARAALELALVDPATRAPAEALSARCWLVDGQAEQAIAALNSAVAAWPDEAAWHAQLASLYLQSGEVTAAIPHLQQASEAQPDDAETALALARALRDGGHLAEAKQAFHRAISLLPELAPVWKEAGRVALEVGDAPQAEAWFERACSLSPSDPQGWIGAARAALACGNTRQAYERAESALRLAPDDPDVLMGHGEILERKGRTAEALEAFDRALAVAADSLAVQLAKSRLLHRIGRSAEAAAALRAALDETSTADEPWAVLAEMCEAAGDLPAGLEAAVHAARIAPRDPAHRLLLGRLARKAGHLDQSLDELHRAEALGEAGLTVLLELGRTHEERREYELALDAFERAAAAEPASAEAHYRAGVTLKRLKAYAKAGLMLKRAVDLNPKDPDTLHQLAAVRALELVHGGLQQAMVQP